MTEKFKSVLSAEIAAAVAKAGNFPAQDVVAALAKLSPAELAAFQAENLRMREEQLRERKLYTLYPDDGPLRRELYSKHTKFFAGGGKHEPIPTVCPNDCDGSGHIERGFVGANRSGKTLCVSYELTCHAIGWYPPWWTGRRFKKPISAWAAGEDAKAVRESLQEMLLGKPGATGTGLIPKENIIGTTSRPGVPDAIDAVAIRTAWSKKEESRIVFKAYDQARESFQGAKIDAMVFDEEPPEDIYSEGLTRCIATVPGEENGIVMCSFTPLKGVSKVVQGYFGDSLGRAA